MDDLFPISADESSSYTKAVLLLLCYFELLILSAVIDFITGITLRPC